MFIDRISIFYCFCTDNLHVTMTNSHPQTVSDNKSSDFLFLNKIVKNITKMVDIFYIMCILGPNWTTF